MARRKWKMTVRYLDMYRIQIQKAKEQLFQNFEKSHERSPKRAGNISALRPVAPRRRVSRVLCIRRRMSIED